MNNCNQGRLCLLLGVAAGVLASLPIEAQAPRDARPIVIAHRGASGYLPEHTMAAYELAVRMGADVIEPDLFMTQDGVLIARHDRSLNATTNAVEVAAGDPDLFAKRASNGAYNVDQLTIDDIGKLSARSRTATGYASPGNGYYTADDVFAVPTFGEVLDYAYAVYQTTGRVVGVYPEIKTITGAGAAAYHVQMADTMVAMLADPKYDGLFDGRLHNVYLQSFDSAVVQYLNSITDLPVVFLTSCPATAAAAQTIAGYADGVGISRTGLTSNAACVARSKAAGLIVHVYTLLSDASQHAQVHGWGVDGVFGNHPDVAKAVRDTAYPLQVTGFHPPVNEGVVTAAAMSAWPLADPSTYWHTAPGGSVVPLTFTVQNATSGSVLGTLIGAVETVRVFKLPRCTGPAGAELPYRSLPTLDGGLRFDEMSGSFVLNWQTPMLAAEACLRVSATTRGGTALHAFVRVQP